MVAVIPDAGPPVAGACVVPHDLSIQLTARDTQIFIGELLAALSAVYACRHRSVNRRVLDFVENQGALAALTNGFSTNEDTSAVACSYQHLAASISARVWFEYVESEANVTDGPPREGMAWRTPFPSRACT